jgi:hypothetical protein
VGTPRGVCTHPRAINPGKASRPPLRRKGAPSRRFLRKNYEVLCPRIEADRRAVANTQGDQALRYFGQWQGGHASFPAAHHRESQTAHGRSNRLMFDPLASLAGPSWHSYRSVSIADGRERAKRGTRAAPEVRSPGNPALHHFSRSRCFERIAMVRGGRLGVSGPSRPRGPAPRMYCTCDPGTPEGC